MLDGVEGIEVEPLMLEGAPPRLDHRVRFGDLDLGEDAVEAFGQEVDGGVDVLDAGVGHDRDRRPCAGGIEMLAGIDEDLAGGGGIEACADSPGENLAGEVVDDGVDVRFGAVKQPEDRNVDVLDFVRRRGADADGGFGGVNAKARAVPTALANEPSPRGDGREDLADALGVEAEAAQGMWRYSGARTMSLTVATSAAVSWLGTVLGHGERSSRPQVTATRFHAW